MDPLSIASGIAGLIGLADVVFRSVYKYGKAVVGAKQEVLALSQEINDLSGLLRTLEALVSDLEDGGDAFDPALRSDLLGKCRDTLEKIKLKLKKATDNFQARSKFSGVARQLKWPFASSETKELMTEISRYKETIALAVSSDSMRQLQLLLAKQDEHGKQISAVHTITKRIEINTQILINNDKRRVLDFFMPAKINPRNNLEHNIRLRHPVTGMWLLESDELTKWIQTPGAKLWLSGIPGGGKTVLAAAVIQEALSRGSPQNGVAFFFCDYKNKDTWKPLSVLGAIASQLARQNDQAFDMLKAYFDSLHPERGLERIADLGELRLTVTKIVELFDQVTVVIDGLDECGDQTSDVVDSIADTASDSEKLTIAMFSRNEIDIRLRLEDEFKHIPIAATTGDIELFVGAEIQQRVHSGRFAMLSTTLKDEIRERLVEGANGMFRWVVCQLDYLGEFATDADRRHALHELPPTLHGSYMRLLERLSRLPPRIQLRVQMCLQFIASGDYLLTRIATLCGAVSDFATTGPPLVETNLVSEREVEYRCSSLIRKSKDGNSFEFAHFSVKEFLESTSISENPKLAGFHISDHKYTQLLVPQCLNFIHLSNNYEQQHVTPQNFTSESQERSDFYHYASCMWPFLIRDGLEDPNLVQISCSLVSSAEMQSEFANCWKNFFSLTFTVYLESRYSFGKKYKAARDRLVSFGKPEKWFGDLHLAAALNLPDVCLSLLQAGANPNRRCPYGTPVDLAMRGILALMPWNPAWNEDEPQEMGWGKYSKYERVIYYMVPAASQRNRTIDILIQAGSEVSHDKNLALDLGKESIFSTVSIIACQTKDFTPVIRLLSLGFTPSDSELDALEEYLRQWIFESESSENSRVRDKVLLELLEYLNSTGFNSVWSMRIGSLVWSVASAVGSAFTKEPNFRGVDTRISLSKDGLVHKAQAAIIRDDKKAMKTCLDDKRLDTSQAYASETKVEMTLVELATEYNAIECLEVLLKLGFNEDNFHTKGPSPIPLVHVCIKSKAIGSLRILVDHGISPLTLDPNGLTIFHRCASEVNEFDANLFRDVLELDPHVTAAGLAIKTRTGETPLDLLLLGDKTRQEVEQMVFELINWCDKIPGFWSDHHQLLKNAAAFGSAPVIRRLLELGAKPEPLGPGNLFPLHGINANITLECVRLLKSLYDDSARELRTETDNYLPVELYIMRCVENAKHPDEVIVHELLTPGVIVPKDLTMGTIWTFCCEIIPGRLQESTEEVKSAYVDGEGGLMTQVLSMLLHLGCMHSYEEACSQSALLPFLRGVLDSLGHEWLKDILPIEPGGIIQLVFDSTKYWHTAKTSPTTIRLLKQAIEESHKELVGFLLRRGVDVHQRQDGISAIEFVCEEPLVMKDLATIKGRAMISEILDKTNNESLNEVESNRDGLGLLHRIASCAEPDAAWLMSELVKRGVDIEKESATLPPKTPLMHHLNSKSFDTARTLVKLGASYGNLMMTDKLEDVVHVAAYNGAHEFLRFLLTHSTNNSVNIVWNRPIDITFRFVRGGTMDHEGVTALHQAAFGGNLECLRFFFDERLLEEFEPRTSQGWTPLHCAAWNDSFDIIEFLASKGADVNALANDESSPLHLAVHNECIESTKSLLRLGAVSSRDFWFMTPKLYAIRNGNTILSACFDEAFGSQIGATPDAIPRREMKHVLERLEIAVMHDDIDEFKRLRSVDWPLDTSMPRCHRCSPLVHSLAANSTKVTRWLLENGASTLKIDCSHVGFFVTEIATRTKEMTTLLPQILDRSHNDGADLVFGDVYPIHFAVVHRNFAATKLILQHIESNKSSIGKRAQMDPELVKSTIINRICTVKRYETTPLHLAVMNDLLDMISLLVENGAKLDALDGAPSPPLAYARSESVVFRLLELGASLGPLYENRRSLYKPFRPCVAGHTEFSLSEPLLNRYYTRYSWRWVPQKPYPIELALKLVSRGHDLTHDHGVGRSIIHDLICFNTSASLVLHNRELGLDRTTPFPWHLDSGEIRSKHFLVARFRHFRRLLSSDDFTRILNLQPDRGRSPLCMAALINRIDIMENCLEMGADIDFEGSAYGSALMTACIHGNLESVKLLVRRGAQTSYSGGNGPVNVMEWTQSRIVRQWLLIGRFNEQKRIVPAENETPNDRIDCIHAWSGIRRAKLKLTGSYELGPYESYFDYAKRLARISKVMRGRIVPDFVEDSEV